MVAKGREGKGEGPLMAIEFFEGDDVNVLKLDGGDSCATLRVY